MASYPPSDYHPLRPYYRPDPNPAPISTPSHTSSVSLISAPSPSSSSLPSTTIANNNVTTLSPNQQLPTTLSTLLSNSLLSFLGTGLVMPFEVGKTLLQVEWKPKQREEVVDELEDVADGGDGIGNGGGNGPSAMGMGGGRMVSVDLGRGVPPPPPYASPPAASTFPPQGTPSSPTPNFSHNHPYNRHRSPLHDDDLYHDGDGYDDEDDDEDGLYGVEEEEHHDYDYQDNLDELGYDDDQDEDDDEEDASSYFTSSNPATLNHSKPPLPIPRRRTATTTTTRMREERRARTRGSGARTRVHPHSAPIGIGVAQGVREVRPRRGVSGSGRRVVSGGLENDGRAASVGGRSSGMGRSIGGVGIGTAGRSTNSMTRRGEWMLPPIVVSSPPGGTSSRDNKGKKSAAGLGGLSKGKERKPGTGTGGWTGTVVGGRESVWEMMKRVGKFKNEGWGGLWKGQFTTFMLDSLTATIQPIVFSVLTPLIPPSASYIPSPKPLLIISVASHLVTGLLLSPFDLIRTRLIVQSSQTPHRKYAGPFDGLNAVAEEEGGWKAQFLHLNLLIPTMLDCSIRPLLHLGIPVLLTHWVGLSKEESGMRLTYGLAEFMLGTCGLLITLPIETIRKRLQVQTRFATRNDHDREGIVESTSTSKLGPRPLRTIVETRLRPYSGVLEAGYRIMTEEIGGVTQLYRGFGIGVVANGVVFLLGLVAGREDRGGWAEM